MDFFDLNPGNSYYKTLLNILNNVTAHHHVLTVLSQCKSDLHGDAKTLQGIQIP